MPQSALCRDYFILAAVSAAVSVAALIFFYSTHAILLFGDAVAHINIARRVIDSRTPGLFQLGTVWLPLPHLLDIPFVMNDWLWRTGLGASIPSMIAYVAGTLGVFRLVCGLTLRTAAWLAALAYAANPNLIYMQATAMTEPLYLALFIWAVVFFAEFTRQAGDDPQAARRSLEKCAITLSAAMMVRYDGWFLAAVIGAGVIVVLWRNPGQRKMLGGAALRFFLLTALTAVFWLAYNYGSYDNALEFANGPYSAHAIAQQSRTASMTSHPGENDLRTAALFFLKASRLNMGEGITERLLFTIAFVALLSVIYFARSFLPWIVLWAPVLFYVVCIAWGSVPIYLPDWWPHSYYNVRYGLQMLPAIAVFFALAYEFAAKFMPVRRVAALAIALITFSYGSVWQHEPICLREAKANSSSRINFESKLASELQKLPSSATLMMDCSAHSEALQMAGIPFRRVLRESNSPAWQTALGQPAQSADYVIAVAGDDVATAVHFFPRGLQPVATVDTPGQPRAVIYRSVR